MLRRCAATNDSWPSIGDQAGEALAVGGRQKRVSAIHREPSDPAIRLLVRDQTGDNGRASTAGPTRSDWHG